MACTCRFPARCNGSGRLSCAEPSGCCFCSCGCEEDCYGCENCDGHPDDIDDDTPD